MILILPLLLLVVYFLMLRPQKKRMREQAALQAGLEIGDEVVTNFGVYGFITGVEDDKFWVEIDDDVQIRVAKAAIQGRVKPVSDDSAGKAADEVGDSDASDAS